MPVVKRGAYFNLSEMTLLSQPRGQFQQSGAWGQRGADHGDA